MCIVEKQKVKIYKSVCTKTSVFQDCGPMWRDDKRMEDQVKMLLYDSYLTLFLFKINVWFSVKWPTLGCMKADSHIIRHAHAVPLRV